MRRKRSGITANLIAQSWALNAAYQIAEVLAWQGEIDLSYDWLAHADDGHDPGLNYLKYDPMLKILRPDPRYAALLRKMKLPLD